MKNRLISLPAVLGFLVIIVAGYVVFGSPAKQDRGDMVSVATVPSPNGAASGISLPSPQLSPEATPHPVSLPAIAQKTFDGRDLTIGKVLSETANYTRYSITYKSGELTISGIMNKPKGDGPFPVLILNHGYIDPAVYTSGRGLKREQDYLASRGYAIIHPDYGNHAESTKTNDEDLGFRIGYVEDVINAVYAIRESDLTYLDKERIGMLGHSMGGGITLGILTTHPELIKAAVLFAPVSANAKDNYEKYTVNRLDAAAKVQERFGTAETNPEFWANVSPETFFDKVSVPIMIHHGTVDESTPIGWSNSLVDKLKAKNKDVTYHVYSGEPHEFINAWPIVMQRTLEFFNKTVR